MINKDFYKTAAGLFKKHKCEIMKLSALSLVLLAACSLSYMAGRHRAGETETAGSTEADGRDTPQISGVVTGTPSFAFPPYAEYSDATASNAEIMGPCVLNLASLYGDGTDTGAVSESRAGQLYKRLASMDAQWFSGLYDLYGYTPERLAAQTGVPAEAVTTPSGIIPEFSNVSVQIVNGDHQAAPGASNAREIISMVNVLHYYGVLQDQDEMESYAEEQWKSSHWYTASIGEIYYCDGSCQNTTAEPAGEESAVPDQGAEAGDHVSGTTAAHNNSAGPGVDIPAATDNTASPSDALNQAVSNGCPGHVDCSILAVVKGVSETDSLFKTSASLPAGSGGAVSWAGWNEDTMACVRELSSQDWYEKYGLNITDFPLGHPLSSQEIDLYMQLVPADASETRKGFIKYALSSVGKIPYYWGGKPSAPGYTGNNFGMLTVPDEDERLLKGLDCSGWINWVYWSVTGRGLGAQSTGTLLGCGVPVSREQLLPGDICIRTGPMSHVVIFLGWTEEGNMLCIQETTGNANNVEVGITAPDWESYRRILE